MFSQPDTPRFGPLTLDVDPALRAEANAVSKLEEIANGLPPGTLKAALLRLIDEWDEENDERVRPLLEETEIRTVLAKVETDVAEKRYRERGGDE